MLNSNKLTRVILKSIYLIICLAILSFTNNANAKLFQNQADIDAFYLQREGKPLWISRSRLNKSGKNLLTILKKSWQNGLNPNNYNLEQIYYILDNSRGSRSLRDNSALEIELLLTDAYINYIRDLSGMRINARDMELNPRDWKQRISAQMALSLLSDNTSKNITKFLLAQEPQGQTYQRLKSELVSLIEENAYNNPEYEIVSFNGIVRPGRGYNDIPKLRARLGVVSELEKDRYVYDAKLVDAIISFQTANGLKPDGIIGAQTLHALNRGYSDKVKQLIVNMERLRWVYDKKPERFIIVNIPSATLWAIDNGKVRFEMPVIVGRKKRPTNSFITYIHGVRFNPSWTVPETIKKEDILPELQANYNYLANKGIELYEGYGKDSVTLDPFVVDWANVTESELHSLRMVQTPGAHNPLGYIRILMPNPYNIYLHDTNHRELFSRSNRYKSSGCVRLKDPKKVAMFALEKRNNWSQSNMLSALKSRKTRDIYTSERIPVYLLYHTMWIGDKNQIIYGYDVYNHDEILLNLLEKLDGFVVSLDNEDKLVQIVD